MGRSLRIGAAAAGGYLLGTLPSARLAARLLTGGAIDIRAAGTGNPGALNAARTLGRGAGAAVAVADVGKGVAACAAGRRLYDDPGAHIAGVAAVIGHCYPSWSGLRGGKGVATSFGQCLYTFPAYAPLDAALAAALTRLPTRVRPDVVSVGCAAIAWVGAGVVWWQRRLPNLWGPRPTAALPLGNAATAAVLVSRAIVGSRRGEHHELSQ